MKYDPAMKQKRSHGFAQLITESVSAHAVWSHLQQTEDLQNYFMV